jgi:hypothetical protein
MYDSDSSDEGSTRKSKTISLIAPLELPFATRSLSERVEPDVTNSTHIDEHNFDDYAAQPASPFVANNNTYGIHEENNSWFLVQLPTRLPPMQKNVSRQENDNDDAEGGEGANRNTAMDSTASSANDNTMNNLSEVAVPPVTTSCFDHGLDKNAPGKIGKILVYKSGKTVLVLDGPDDKVRSSLSWWTESNFVLRAQILLIIIFALNLFLHTVNHGRERRLEVQVSPASRYCEHKRRTLY